SCNWIGRGFPSMGITNPDPLLTLSPPLHAMPPTDAPPRHRLEARRPRRWLGRLLWYVASAGTMAAILWAGAVWWLPARKAGDVLTAAVTRGELVITVTDRGELESSQSLQVVCEVE